MPDRLTDARRRAAKAWEAHSIETGIRTGLAEREFKAGFLAALSREDEGLREDEFEYGVAHRSDDWELHRSGMTRQEAHDWIDGWAADGGAPNAFRVMRRRLGAWEPVASPVASRECARCHRPDYMHAATIPEQGIFECWVDGALVCVGWVPPPVQGSSAKEAT